jgi:hypothetical protein
MIPQLRSVKLTLPEKGVWRSDVSLCPAGHREAILPMPPRLLDIYVSNLTATLGSFASRSGCCFAKTRGITQAFAKLT